MKGVALDDTQADDCCHISAGVDFTASFLQTIL